MMKDAIEEAERWDLEPKPARLWWTSSHARENGRREDQDEHRAAHITVREEVQDSGIHLQSCHEDAGQLG